MVERFLEIRLRETREVVTVLELLAPSNKRAGSEGRRGYLAKREQILSSRTNLVELDLLRGGERLPIIPALPPADCFALVRRGALRPKIECYFWTVREALGTAPIPLRAPDAAAHLDLQAAIGSVYQRAGYAQWLDYAGPPQPPMKPEDASWAMAIVASAVAGVRAS